MKKAKFIVGIDEAGRGPLAGPVAVGVVLAEPGFFRSFNPGRDSKAMSAKGREDWLIRLEQEMAKGNVFLSRSLVSNTVIDRRGIRPSIDLAVGRSLAKLGADPEMVIVYLDGGLRASDLYQNQQTIIKGDTKVSAISLASVVAKVSRDGVMDRLSSKYPEYGFARHRGYATEEHYLALLRHGPSPVHRRSFLSFLK